MNLDHIRELKRQLERDITHQAKNFEMVTGVSIQSMDMLCYKQLSGKSEVHCVTVTAEV